MHLSKMRRFQIYLDPNTDTRLRRLSAKTGKPKSVLIRDGINLLFEKEVKLMDDSLLDLAGIGEEGEYPDASENHDKYLALSIIAMSLYPYQFSSPENFMISALISSEPSVMSPPHMFFQDIWNYIPKGIMWMQLGTG